MEMYSFRESAVGGSINFATRRRRHEVNVNAVALRSFDTEIARESASRDALLERYRQLRAISRTVHMGAVNATPREVIQRMGRRLGLVQGKVFALESPDELDFVFDLIIYTAPPGETRPVDRYARRVGFAAGSDEALMLSAMRASRFAFVRVERRHDIAGLILADLTRHEEIWLMDEGMESSLPDGYVFFTRLHALEAFCMTAGVFVPVDDRLLSEALDGTTCFSRKTMREAVEDRRFAEAIYRAALRNGICDRIRFQDAPPPDDAGDMNMKSLFAGAPASSRHLRFRGGGDGSRMPA